MRVAGVVRNRWPACPGMGGRNQSEWVAGFLRNRRPESSGIRIFLFANAVHADEPYVPKEKEELYGIWVNEKYDGKPINSMWYYNSDGTWASYIETTGERIWAGPYSITEKWTDGEESLWYKIKWEDTLNGSAGYGLLKISDSGETLEAAYSMGDYPVKIDPNKSFYQYGGIHYRKKS